MKSEWRVTSNRINGQTMYGVYRLLDTRAVDHSGNREHFGGYMAEREWAEDLAKKLNYAESQIVHKWIPSENDTRRHCEYCGIYEDYQNKYPECKREVSECN